MSGLQYEVVFMAGQNEVAVPFQDKTLAEAQEIAKTLNDGLQSKARAMGFSYAVRPQKSRLNNDGREHDVTDDIPSFEESRYDYLPEPEW